MLSSIFPRPGEAAAGERAPGDHADAFALAERHHFAFFLAIHEVVVVLHRDESRPAVAIGEVERLGELPGVHAARADVASLAGLHHVVERGERFFDRRFVIPAMDLVEVDVVGAEAAEAVVDFGEDRFAREAGAVRVGPHAAVDLGGEHDRIARGHFLEQLADDFFAGAIGVDVGGVEEVDAGVERLLDEGPGFFFRQRPGMGAAVGHAVAHAAETDAGDFEAAVAEAGVLHGVVVVGQAMPDNCGPVCVSGGS